MGDLAAAVRRLDRATPPSRDRGIDALRALAIGGVVLGHWLVTAWEPGPRISSPLVHLPHLAPASWVLQTLAVFFLVGGYVAALGVREPYRTWVGGRLRRLLGPVVPLVVCWAVVAAFMPWPTLEALGKPALGPLWFLGVFVLLTSATPLLMRVRHGVPVMVAVVAVVDLARFGLDAPAWVGWLNAGAAWLVPYLLGLSWARGTVRPSMAWWLLGGGAAVTAVLVGWAGYPASMVGVPGADVSNLSPPTLASVSFGLAQAGLAMLAREPLGRLMRRTRVWAVVALVNLNAMRIFLWHQTVLVALVVCAAVLYGRPDGLGWLGLNHRPDDPGRQGRDGPDDLGQGQGGPDVPGREVQGGPAAPGREGLHGRSGELGRVERDRSDELGGNGLHGGPDDLGRVGHGGPDELGREGLDGGPESPGRVGYGGPDELGWVGLLGRPDDLGWVAGRLVWVPVLVLALVATAGLMTWCRQQFDERLRRL
ncbi:acyltransferase [Nonomuraea sp. NPDC050328]|uniref:acyltransferase n=1 Tax=Nonomuraea sp. NPDC050328 TaxID=3364361 RepID=UPI0037878074